MNKKEQKPLYAIGLFGFYKKQPPDPRYAGFHRRMLAAMIDITLAILILTPLTNVLMGFFSPPVVLDWSSAAKQITPEMNETQINHLMWQHLLQSGYLKYRFETVMTQMTVLAVLCGLCWRLWGATPGKRLLGIKVVDAASGKLLSDTQVIIRLFGYLISAIFLCLGFFWIDFDKRRQGWHDKLARSVVIRTSIKPAVTAAAESDSPAPSKEE